MFRDDKARPVSRLVATTATITFKASASHAHSNNTDNDSDNEQKVHDRLRTMIESHPFNYEVNLLLPASHDNIQPVLADLEALYTKATLPLKYFLDDGELGGYSWLKSGRLLALSVHERIDGADVVAIDGRGKMILSVTKDTYEILGLEGKPAQCDTKAMRFVITLDFTEQFMKPRKKKFERIRWCFENTFTRTFDFYMLGSNVENNASEPIPIPSNYPSFIHPIKPTVTDMHGLVAPIPEEFLGHLLPDNAHSKFSEEALEKLQDMYEWIGMSCLEMKRLQSDNVEKLDPFITMYSHPEPNYVQRYSLIKWKGLIPSRLIEQIWYMFSKRLSQTPNAISALITHGFRDAPISFHDCHHGYGANGEHLYAMVAWHVPSARRERWVVLQQVDREDGFS
ncbi:hypothetical protein BZG36_03320 [Bifiguratus adelaidae]|uniref:Uncharacterized protein n=1 Tax=Bifiguratus adelaidae TaxID=1938954 RepID=A0A261XXV4_9FUNG|nr:hypothetical protein BZG36_03320 [Bifiguratus adelaidae]